MTETKTDKIERLRMMARDDGTWDLSDNDTAALKLAVASIDRLRAFEEAVRDMDSAMEELERMELLPEDLQCQMFRKFQASVIAKGRAIARLRALLEIK